MFDKQFRMKADGSMHTEREFRELLENKSLPKPILEIHALENGADMIVEVPEPEYNRSTHTARVDGVELVNGTWSWKWVVEAKPAEIVADEMLRTKNDLIRQIDIDVDTIYGAVMGNRASEYTLAEQEALAYRDAGYTGTVPSSVSVWATAKAKTNKWATDDIIATAIQWRTAQMTIRSNRLTIKEMARAADTAPKLAEAITQWNTFTNTVRGMLGL